MPLPPRTLLGPYEILAPLGAGGMGEVYRAHDSRLGRDVAIKILPQHLANNSDLLTRFEREAKALAALSHPNIVIIFDIGNESGLRFAVMELLEGETLREQVKRSRCPPERVAEVGAAIAEALSAAHARGIIHRDLKPENIFLTTEKRVKVLDFGLARTKSAITATGGTSGLTATIETATGTIMGTLAYMSPEQLRGNPAGPASDVFSLGCVLYEMAAGRSAFYRPSPAETISAILTETPPRITASAELDRIVSRCLARDARDRFQSASDVASALRLLGQARAPGRKTRTVQSIAVLPFANAGSNAGTDYLCDGMTESLINQLSGLPKLRVVPRSTVFRYKGAEIELDRAVRELDVKVLLTGRILQHDDILSVQAELVDVAAGSQLWGQKYNRRLTDISVVEEEIAREIVSALRLKLSSVEKKRLVRRATRDSEAYQLYLKGRYLWNKRTRDGLDRAIEYFQQAIERDPAYALAYAGLADCYLVLGSFAFGAPHETWSRARVAARHAIEIDQDLAEAHVTLAITDFFDLDRTTAEREFQSSLAINPNYAIAWQWHGTCLCLVADFQKGLSELCKAQQLEPLSPMINVQLGVGYYLSRRYAEAEQVLQKTVEFESSFWPAHCFLGVACGQQNDPARAIAEMEIAVELSRRHPLVQSSLGHILCRTSRREHAAAVLEELHRRSRTEYVAPYHLALVHLGLGEENAALERLQETVTEHSPYASWLKVEPRLDSLRSDARFEELLRRVFGSGAAVAPLQKQE